MILTKSAILKTEQKTVWTSKGLTVPAFQICTGRQSSPVSLVWDPSKTNLVTARLVITKAVPLHVPMTMKTWLNSIPLKTFYWPHGAEGVEKADVIDVLVPLRNGTNNFEVEICLDYRWWGESPAIISAYREYEYAGEDPEEEDQDTWAIFKEWLGKYWWIAIPAVALAVVTVPRRST